MFVCRICRYYGMKPTSEAGQPSNWVTNWLTINLIGESHMAMGEAVECDEDKVVDCHS